MAKTSTKAEESKAIAVIEKQYDLPLEEVRKLIVVPSGMRPNNETIQNALNIARSVMVPLWGINLIPGKSGQPPRVYINAEGIEFVLNNDPRGVQSNEMEILKVPTKESPLAIVKRIITMKTGQVYHGLGAVLCGPGWDLDNGLLKADTKAGRRGAYKAVSNRIGLPQYDEDNPNHNLKGDFIDAEIKPAKPQTVIELLSMVTDEELDYVLGAGWSDITDKDVEGIYERILNIRVKKDN